MRILNLVDLVHDRGIRRPDDIGFRFLRDGGDTDLVYTYGDLDKRARTIGGFLQSSVTPRSRALLACSSNSEFLAAFFGCLYAGVVAVPVYLPRREQKSARFLTIAEDAQPAVALTESSHQPRLKQILVTQDDTSRVTVLSSDQIPEEFATIWKHPVCDVDATALLQYTSGATGSPKGVMLTHGNLLHNQQMIMESFGHSQNSVVVSWLPLQHDMGFIGCVLQPLYVGFPTTLMKPEDFVKEPFRWLAAISDYRATTSGGPNFAFDLCVARITEEQKSRLDLSSWSVAFNGSEQVRAETLERFTHAFASCGFRRKSFLPCYGLAENSLFVTGGDPEHEPVVRHVSRTALLRNSVEEACRQEDSVGIVGCGHSGLDQRVVIVDPVSMKKLPFSQVGEIWVQGGSVARGYWRDAELTRQTFGASLDSGEGPFLRTGDLGFVENGELFVTGRLKDLIIIRGQNYHPHMIEQTVEQSHQALHPNGACAFSVEVADQERLVVIHEVKRGSVRGLDSDAVIRSIVQSVSLEHELAVHVVQLVNPATLPRTPNGKIQRKTCRDRFLTGEIESIASWRRESGDIADSDGTNFISPDAQLLQATIERIRLMISKISGIKQAKLDNVKPLIELGMDSLSALELRSCYEVEVRRPFPADLPLHKLSIAKLAAMIVRGVHEDSLAGSERGDTDTIPTHADLFAKFRTHGGYLDWYRSTKDRYFLEPILQGTPGPHMTFQGKDVIVWSLNNYLGIAGRPEIRTAVQKAAAEFGTWAPMGSRMLTGNTERHVELEKKLAEYCRKQTALLFNMGYMGVLGTVTSAVGSEDVVIIDSQSHASIVDAARLASPSNQLHVFKHNSVDMLEDQLRWTAKERRGGVLVVTEGVFGMSGELAPLKDICELKDRYGARLMVDDAHGIGVMGCTGRGTGEHFGVQSRIDLYFATFTKSFAALGGFAAGPEEVMDYIRFNARPNLFSRTLPGVYVEAIAAALELMEKRGDEFRNDLWKIAARLQGGLVNLGFDLGHTKSPVTPVFIRDKDENTLRAIVRALREDGIFVSGASHPAVPSGTLLIRMIPTAAHSAEDVDRTLAAFEKVRDRFHLAQNHHDPAYYP